MQLELKKRISKPHNVIKLLLFMLFKDESVIHVFHVFRFLFNRDNLKKATFVLKRIEHKMLRINWTAKNYKIMKFLRIILKPWLDSSTDIFLKTVRKIHPFVGLI